MNRRKQNHSDIGQSFLDMVSAVFDGKPAEEVVEEFVYGDRKNRLKETRKTVEGNPN